MRKRTRIARASKRAHTKSGQLSATNGADPFAARCQSQTARHQGWFTWFAQTTAHMAGKPVTFLIALTLIIVWAFSGPIFGFSDTWQLVVNTATTIITFLMVFLIQNTQNRDTLALQIKLAELIIAMRGTHNNLALAEELSDSDLEALHEEYRKRAEQAEDSLEKRRSSGAH